MSVAGYTSARTGARPRFSIDTLQRIMLWLFMFSGWYVVIEPAPYEYMFLLWLFVAIIGGLQYHRAIIPLIVFLVLYNIGGVLAVIPVAEVKNTNKFVITSIYMAATSVFIANLVATDTLRRLAIIKNGYILAAVIASILGMIGYFDIFGMEKQWAPLFRAQGTFKDPNVLSTYLIAPAVFLVQGFMTGTQKWRIPSAIALLIIVAGIFFAFSRGAWVSSAASVMMLAGLTFILTPSVALRTRIILLSIFGFIVLAVLFSVAMSFESIRSIFLERANLLNSYDAGEAGRFGTQLRAIPTLLQSPNGLGPFQFARQFGADPHNVFMNAFAAYGWLGGISYLALIGTTMMIGWKTVFTPSPWQFLSIAVWCPLFFTILQGIQIDTDHWRHFYLLLGLMWGLYAATGKYTSSGTN